MDKLEIISRIGYFRVKAKLTQKDLSHMAGMNHAYISRLESKKDFLPSVEVLLNIISACGSTPEEFFYNDISAYEKDMQILKKVKALPNAEIILDSDAELLKLIEKVNGRLTDR